jgi:NAD+ synthase (glutamine-hydrolysing)
MKIALAQLNYHIGNFEDNSKKIIAHIQRARAEGADLIVFSELSVCGYPPLDFLEFDDFINQCDEALRTIVAECAGIAAIVGLPVKNPVVEGKNLFNSACFINDSKIISFHHKTLLPNYDVFDEYRYFESGKNTELIALKGKKIALTVCEDLWNIEEEEKLYYSCPMDELTKKKPDLMINIAASPFSYQHNETRKRLLYKNVMAYQIPLIYVNQVGSHTELIFDGGSLVFNSKGKVLDSLAHFQENFKIIDTEEMENDHSLPDEDYNHPIVSEEEKMGRIHDALVLGIRDYFHKMGFKKGILGLSGGIDSALTLVLAARALGPENVKAILMPSMYSSEHSIKDAVDLAENLGCEYEIINISDIYHSFEKALGPFFKNLPTNIAEENLQSRSRGVLLMAMSNKFGNILLNTSNKSELATGYGTLYGDMCGGLSVIGDLYKTEVFALSKFINKEKEIIPVNTITKPPSAELKPDQKDSDTLPDYEILDKILFEYIENKKGPAEIIQLGFEKILVERVLRMVNMNEYKRKQAPPILRVSTKAFGMGRRMPLVGKYLS